MKKACVFAAAGLSLCCAFADLSVTNKRNGAVFTLPEPTARVVYGSHAKQYAEIWLPQGAAPEGGRPIAVYVHGGAWTSGEAIDVVLAEHIRPLLERDIAVASVSYRLLQEAGDVKPPVKAVRDDVVAAVEALKAQSSKYGMNKYKIGLIGGSAGACISLAVGLVHGNPLGISYVGAAYPQTSLDPKEMKAWIPNQGKYGAHAFGMSWESLEAKRDEMLPLIEEFSPAALARKIDPFAAPEIVMEYWGGSFPAKEGATVKDPVHSAQFGIGFEKICKERGIKCELLKGPCKEVWKRMADTLCGDPSEETFKPGKQIKHTFDDPSMAPIAYGGESCAVGAAAGEYCLYLDIQYADGTWKYVERAFFQNGTHGWQPIRSVFVPAKPVKLVSFNMLFRSHPKGTVLFRRPWLKRVEAKPGETIEIGVTIRTDRPFSCKDVREGWRFDGKKTVKFCERIDPFFPTDVPLAAEETAVWSAPATRTVTPLDFPSDAEKTARSVSLDLARAERESFQINISSGASAGKDGVTLEIGKFADAKGRPFDGSVTWERVGYLMRENGYTVHPDAPPARFRWLPDPLLPAAPMKARAGGTQGAWVTAHAARTAKPGAYSGKIAVKAADGGTLAEFDVSLKVRGFALPKYFGMQNSVAVMDGFTKRAYPDRFKEMRRKSWDIMLDCRLNPDDISRTELPEIDELLYARERGMSMYNILNIVPKPKKPVTWVCYASPAETDNDAFYDTFTARVRPWYEEAKKKGLGGLGYIYGFDERDKEYYSGIKRFWNRWRAEFPDIPVLTSAMMYRDMARKGGDTNLVDCLITDWHCPLTPEYKQDFAETLRRDYGMKVFWYVCCSPRHPYANFASLEHPAREARVLGWQTWSVKADGLLYWLVNDWGRDKLDESDTFFDNWHTANSLHMPCDGVMMYPGKETVLSSIRLVSMRDGVEDYERLDIVSRAIGREKTMESCKRVSPRVVEFDRTGEAMLRERSLLADEFEKAMQ